MPWFPEFANAVELARRQVRIEGQADPVARYIAALNQGDARTLETVWPGEVVVYDPSAGEVRGHRHLRQFVRDSQSVLTGHHVRTQTMASTVAGNRAVVELLGHLVAYDGQEMTWPAAIVAESPDDRSVVFRTYLSRWVLDGRRHLRPAILASGSAHPGDVVGRYRGALAAGDTDAIVSTFTPDGYYREPSGPHPAHRGAGELRSFFTTCFGAGGGIGLQDCVVTDDGVRCALEYNCLRWGRHDLTPQAGIAIFERSRDGLLAAVRVYDEVEAPADQP